ncbi:type II secretory pathway predicted ATPase ExeA [Clostridium algifaecis]|uniref:Type II secretory pathway predicted ATPase ExeA n=1 Tax=Clostridium algifaecis TaxID=1472040 RepID=A0ABS4KVB5_9CLOT|nr:type II secretory pathway predicted ATPase ExeA [Clostridium algifaecis]
MLNNILSKQIHEALKQRIVINYNYQGISKEEAENYIYSRMQLCGVPNKIFNGNAVEAINSCSNGSIRVLNNIIEKCLILGYQKNSNVIDTEIVMSAQNEIELI